MAKGHNDDGSEKDNPTGTQGAKGNPTSTDTDASEERGAPSTTRRTLMKSVGVAALGIGGAATLSENVSAAEFTASPSGEVMVSPGEYTWDGGLDIGSGDALVGDGSPGDVVATIESGSMDGSIEGRLENIVVRGENPESKAGINLYPGATVDGLIWPEGGQQSEDRALYTPTGGDERLTIRNSAWANMVNNGAYVDKPPSRWRTARRSTTTSPASESATETERARARRRTCETA